MKVNRLTSVLLFSLSLLMALSFGFVKAGPVQAQEGAAGVPLVKFEGVIEAKGAETWTIDGQTVKVTAATIIVETEGKAEVGAQVVVVAKKVDSTLEAIMIRVKPAQSTSVVYLAGKVKEYLEGEKLVIETMGGEKTIIINSGTQIEGDPGATAPVYVLVKARFDGSEYVALMIKVVHRQMQRIVEFDGIVTKIEKGAQGADDVWTIGDFVVLVKDPRVVLGNIVVGDRVKVRAYKDGDDLVALMIKKAGASWWPKMERFSGPIKALPATPPIGTWTINDGTADRQVTVTHFTRVRGEPVVGAIAHVTAWSFSIGEQCVAMEIKIEGDAKDEVVVEGTIAQLPERGFWGKWVIDEGQALTALREVLVMPGTEIEGMPEVGAPIKVTGVEQPDGVVVAKDVVIEIDEPIEGIHLIGKITKMGDGYIEIVPPVAFGTLTIRYTPSVVTGELAVGKCVAVLARALQGNEYEAITITVVDCPGPKGQVQDIVRTLD